MPISRAKPGRVVVYVSLILAASVVHADQATEILDATGVRGGLVVHIGCGDGKLTAALHANDRYLVHGLDQDARKVEQARRHIRSLGLYGDVCVDTFDGRSLPYTDSIANLIVAEDLGEVSVSEVMRVLCPHGVAYIKTGGKWTTTVKPRPDDIDEWTHYLHDASNNAVAHDRRIGPPRHLQLQFGPRWTRHHDHMSSITALVSAGERIFYIFDEGSHFSPQLPSDWKLIARGAFNGVLLWKRPIEKWQTSLWPLKSGPASLPRRLVASGDKVFVTLGIDAGVTALDAASGETLCEYEGTAGAEEIVLKDGVLLVLVNRTPVDMEKDLTDDSEEGRSRDRRTTYSGQMAKIWAGIRSRRWSHGDRVIRAFDARTGHRLWENTSHVIPLTLAADSDNVYFHDGEKIAALDLATGKQCWTSEPAPVWQGLDGSGLQSWFAPTLVVHDGKVLFAGGEKMHMSYMGWGSNDIGQDTMTAFSAKTGRKLWTADHPYSGYNSPEDLFVADGRVWAGVTAKSGPGGRYIGHDLSTGKTIADLPPTVNTHWFHHRCYRAKATDRYILSSRNGIEFIDLKTGEWTINHWVRGACLYGIMPAQGLIYSPHHPCACYPEAKLNGFTALAAASASRKLPETIPSANRLQRGPAYGAASNLKSQISNLKSDDWPTYRHDPARSGATSVRIPAELAPAWNIELGGRLTPPIAAAGRVFVADIDAHTVHALHAGSGSKLWSYSAGGRIDSPPTYHRGHLLFGSADGYVYCLRAADGALAWRFRAAPLDRRLVAFEQVESLWPVHGSPLVADGIATVVAGRSRFLDGGMRLCRLDVETGRLLSEKVLDEFDPQTGENLQSRIKGLNMPVALGDILSSDGQFLYMRSEAMDLQGNPLTPQQAKSPRDHLFAPYGFTDTSWFHRNYWLFGDSFQGGIGGYGNGRKNPAGRILVNDDKYVFGYGRKPDYFRWSSVLDYRLFAAVRPGGDSGAAQAIHFENSESLDPTGKPLSIAAWVKTEARDGTILVRGAQQIGFALIISNRKPRMLLRSGGKTYSVVGEKSVGGNWTHIAGVLRRDGRMEVYLDGEAVGMLENVPMLSGDPLIPMKVGYDDTNQLLDKPLTPFDGALDEVMLFHRALSGEQIKSLAKPGKTLTKQQRADLVLHLNFNKGKPRDSSPHKNNGSFGGASPKTIEGPAGEAVLFTQPENIVAAAQGKVKSGVAYRWSRDIGIIVRAMALAGDVLFVAGPADLMDEDALFQTISDPATLKQIAAQHAALKGQSGAFLYAVDPATGQTLAEHRLKSLPVFDGLIAAAGRVFITTTNGRLMCLGPRQNLSGG